MTFKLKSGNQTSFKSMGSSPVKSHDGTKSTTTHYEDGSPKSAREQEFSERHESEVAKDTDSKKRKEELLNQGFTPEDADKMIKHGASTGEVDPDAPGGKAIWDAHRAKKKSPMQHGKNSQGTGPHTKFKTETEHEEYHDIHPTEDLNKAEMKEASKPKNTIKVKLPKKKSSTNK